MVIPNIPLPVAGNVTSSQPGASSVAGEGEGATESSGETGGLFAALLATLQGVSTKTVVDAAETNVDAGEDGSPLAALVVDGEAVEAVGLVDVDGEVASQAVVASEGDVPGAVIPPAQDVVVKAVSTKASAEVVPLKSQPSAPTKTPSVATSVPQPVGDVPANTATPVPVSADPLAQIGRPANVEDLTIARAPVPVDVETDAVPDVAPKTLSQAPLLTGVKGPVPTVPVAPVDSAAPVAQPVLQAESRVLEKVGHVTNKHVDDSVVLAKSDSETSVPIDFEKAKQSLSVLRASEESPSTSLRKAIEAFAKPVAGQSESVVNASRPQVQAYVPVNAGDNASQVVADVSRVAPTIAPAELGADAPRTVAAPELPDRPTRTTLTDIAQTAVRSVRYLARNGEHRMTLRLVPESLGEVQIEVVSTKEALSVRLITESAVVREAMEAQTHLLRDSLSQEGLDVKTITVSEEPGSGRGALNQRDANASRNGERGQSQTGGQPAPGQSSGSNAKYAAPRARHEGAFDQVA